MGNGMSEEIVFTEAICKLSFGEYKAKCKKELTE